MMLPDKLFAMLAGARRPSRRPPPGESGAAERRDVDEGDRASAWSGHVAAVSHELRAPLGAIRGALGLLSSGALCGRPAEASEMIAIGIENCDRLLRLVDDLLDLEKMSASEMALRPRSVSAEHILVSGARALGPLAQARGLLVEISIDRVPSIWADEDRLLQVLVNLLANAIHASPPGGVIQLSATSVGAASMRVEVRDQGPGLTPGQRGEIFRRFRQLEVGGQARGGTGLGLAISKAIVELHGGRIGVESEPGKGSCFWFEVPLGPAA